MIVLLIVLPILGSVLAFSLARLHHKLARLPLVVRALIREEAEAEKRRLQAAVASQAGQAIIVVSSYHEGLAASLRAERAVAETRARIAETRAADTAVALEAAAGLLVELRDVLAAAELLRTTAPTPAPVPSDAPRPLPTTKPPRPHPSASGVLRRPDLGPPPSGDSSDETAVYAAPESARVPALLPPAPDAPAEGGAR